MRFGEQNKLLIEINGKPLVRNTFLCLHEAGLRDIKVVVGPDEEAIINALQGCQFQKVRNPKHVEGMGTSISCGVLALPPSTEAVLIIPADMPEMTPKLIKELIKVFEENDGRKIVCPTTPDGSQRNPVIWPKFFFPHLEALKGQKGGKHLFPQYPECVVTVPIMETKAFIDIDTPEDLKAFQERGCS